MPTQEYKRVRLSEGQIDQAGSLFARAFQDNPLLVYMEPDGKERARISPAFFSAFVRFGHLAGEVSTTQNVEGVSIWLPPEVVDLDPELMAQAGITELPKVLGDEPFGRIMKFFGRLESLRKRDAAFAHWYLTLVAVEPDRQGQGVAGSLIRPMLARADSDGVPCYLETADPANVPFYEKYGFEVVVEEIEAESGVRLWTFLRRPHSPHRLADG